MGFHKNLVTKDLHGPSRFRVLNTTQGTGAKTFNKGQVVTVIGESVDKDLEVELIGDATEFSFIVGVLEEDVASQERGFATFIGVINNIDVEGITSAVNLPIPVYIDVSNSRVTMSKVNTGATSDNTLLGSALDQEDKTNNPTIVDLFIDGIVPHGADPAIGSRPDVTIGTEVAHSPENITLTGAPEFIGFDPSDPEGTPVTINIPDFLGHIGILTADTVLNLSPRVDPEGIYYINTGAARTSDITVTLPASPVNGDAYVFVAADRFNTEHSTFVKANTGQTIALDNLTFVNTDAGVDIRLYDNNLWISYFDDTVTPANSRWIVTSHAHTDRYENFVNITSTNISTINPLTDPGIYGISTNDTGFPANTAINITLPAVTSTSITRGDRITIYDQGGVANNKNIIITGPILDGVTNGTGTINEVRASITFLYVDSTTGWSTVAATAAGGVIAQLDDILDVGAYPGVASNDPPNPLVVSPTGINNTVPATQVIVPYLANPDGGDDGTDTNRVDWSPVITTNNNTITHIFNTQLVTPIAYLSSDIRLESMGLRFYRSTATDTGTILTSTTASVTHQDAIKDVTIRLFDDSGLNTGITKINSISRRRIPPSSSDPADRTTANTLDAITGTEFPTHVNITAINPSGTAVYDGTARTITFEDSSNNAVSPSDITIQFLVPSGETSTGLQNSETSLTHTGLLYDGNSPLAGNTGYDDFQAFSINYTDTNGVTTATPAGDNDTRFTIGAPRVGSMSVGSTAGVQSFRDTFSGPYTFDLTGAGAPRTGTIVQVVSGGTNIPTTLTFNSTNVADTENDSRTINTITTAIDVDDSNLTFSSEITVPSCNVGGIRNFVRTVTATANIVFGFECFSGTISRQAFLNLTGSTIPSVLTELSGAFAFPGNADAVTINGNTLTFNFVSGTANPRSVFAVRLDRIIQTGAGAITTAEIQFGTQNPISLLSLAADQVRDLSIPGATGTSDVEYRVFDITAAPSVMGGSITGTLNIS